MKSWKKMVLGVCMVAGAIGTYVYAARPDTDLVEYRVTVQPGDTVWSVCGRIATDRDDLSKVVWQTMRDSGITDAADLQPGTELRVRVKSVADEAWKEK